MSSLAPKLASPPYILKMSERFLDVRAVDKKTKPPDVKLFQTFLGTRNELGKVEEIPPLELNEYICEVIISVRTRDKKDYEPSSLRSLLASFCLIAVNCHFLFERNLSTYEINPLQHGKCFVLFLFTRCFVSENSLVRFLILLNSWIKIYTLGWGERLNEEWEITPCLSQVINPAYLEIWNLMNWSLSHYAKTSWDTVDQMRERWVTRGKFKVFLGHNIKPNSGKNCENSWLWLEESRNCNFLVWFPLTYSATLTGATYAIRTKSTHVLFVYFVFSTALFHCKSLAIGLLVMIGWILKETDYVRLSPIKSSGWLFLPSVKTSLHSRDRTSVSQRAACTRRSHSVRVSWTRC